MSDKSPKEELLKWYNKKISDLEWLQIWNSKDKKIASIIRKLIESQAIQQKPGIDEKCVEEWTRELVDSSMFYDIDGKRQFSINQFHAKKFITQIISDVKGRGK